MSRKFRFQAQRKEDVSPLIAAIGDALVLVQIVEARDTEEVVVNLTTRLTRSRLAELMKELSFGDRMLETLVYTDTAVAD